MPVYEYSCQGCGRTLEIIRKFSDAPLTRCPECGGTLKKLISNTSFVLKGSGWYVTDYARKGTVSQGTESPSDKRTAPPSDKGTESPAGKGTESPAGKASGAAGDSGNGGKTKTETSSSADKASPKETPKAETSASK